MKKILVIIVLVLAAIAIISASRNNPGAILSRIGADNLRGDSKELVYKVYLFGAVPAGEAVIADKGLDKFEGKNVYRLSASAKGSNLISKIYPFEAALDSYLDPGTFLPLTFKQVLRTKDKETVKEVSYDQKSGIMRIADVKRTIFPETYEPLSALYKLRGMDLNSVPVFDLNINTNQKNYAFTGTINKEELRLKNETVNIFRLKGKIFRRDKNPYHQSHLEIVFLDNPRKTPLSIKVFASGALLTVRLTDTRL